MSEWLWLYVLNDTLYSFSYSWKEWSKRITNRRLLRCRRTIYIVQVNKSREKKTSSYSVLFSHLKHLKFICGFAYNDWVFKWIWFGFGFGFDLALGMHSTSSCAAGSHLKMFGTCAVHTAHKIHIEFISSFCWFCFLFYFFFGFECIWIIFSVILGKRARTHVCRLCRVGKLIRKNSFYFSFSCGECFFTLSVHFHLSNNSPKWFVFLFGMLNSIPFL